MSLKLHTRARARAHTHTHTHTHTHRQTVEDKGKVHPTTGHEGPEMYSSTSLTSALYGGGWSTPRPGRFTPGKDPVPIV